MALEMFKALLSMVYCMQCVNANGVLNDYHGIDAMKITLAQIICTRLQAREMKSPTELVGDFLGWLHHILN